MSSIDKLRILGVRNFGIKHSEAIQFEIPLTLIVGYNGSGKTTIIECLKYATTGALPPNSKQGAFVHDPKLVGEKEVLAQVKLAFRNPAGHSMIVTRSIHLQVKKGAAGVKQSAVDSSLVSYINGERAQISAKVAQLDEVVPQILGVSPAIIENVIFCHQDESLWPMSEPGQLKKRFDSIFEASKWTRAVEDLKAMRKKKVDETKVLEVEQKHAKENKAKAEKARQKMIALSSEMDELRQKVEQAGQEKDAAKVVRDQLRAQATEVMGSVEKLKIKRGQAHYLQGRLDMLEPGLEEFQESDEWLKNTLEQYASKIQQYEEQQEMYEAEYIELGNQVVRTRQDLAAKQAEQGRQQAEKDSYNASLKSRLELVKDAARLHSMRGYEGEVDEDQVQDFVDRVQKVSQEKGKELTRAKDAAVEDLKKTQGVLDGLSNSRATYTQQRVNAQQTIDGHNKKLPQKQREADQIKMEEGTNLSLNASFEDLEAQHREAEAQHNNAGWDKRLDVEKSLLKELKSERSRLQDESDIAHKNAQSRASLDYALTQIKKARKNLDVQRSTYNDQFSSLIGPDWSVETLENDFQTELDSRTRAVADAKKKQQSLAEELSEINLRLKSLRANLAKKKDDRQKCLSIVLASTTGRVSGKPITSIEEYEPESEDLKLEYEDVQKSYDGQKYITSYYTSSREIIDKHNACKLCERQFANAKEKTSALAKVNALIQKYATDTVVEELQHLAAAYKKSSAARLQYDMYNELNDKDIPALDNEISNSEKEQAPLVKRLEQQDILVSEKETACREAELLRTIVQNTVAIGNAIAENEIDIARLSSQAKTQGTSRSSDDIKEDSVTCDLKLQAQTDKISKLQSDFEDSRSKMFNLEREVNAARDKAKTAKYDMERKRGILSSIAELNANIAQQREIIQQADRELEGLQPKVATAEKRHADTRQRGWVKERDIQAEKDKLAETVNKFELINNSIIKYESSNGSGKLAAIERAIKTCNQEIINLSGEQTEAGRKSNEMKKRVEDSDKIKKSMEANLVVRQTRRELEAEKRDIAALAQQNFQEEFERLDAESNAAATRWQVASAEQSVAGGALTSADKTYTGLLEEWNTDYYNANEVYREAHVKLGTNEAAAEDLGKFTKALDQAIMKYHTVKMEEINAVAAELWRSTYQGTDVDTIMIRSETENAANKRAINYRLVMVKQDTEMDMRGRCSAGQRVLACIIIRLALAECFGVNCGVIALDEPTTNLDSDNIKALAISLNQIIKHRRHQKNFQLIIITHDEEFLKHMKCNEFTDHYFRVFRGQDQKSYIHHQSLAGMM